jgi:hypothetical protein
LTPTPTEEPTPTPTATEEPTPTPTPTEEPTPDADGRTTPTPPPASDAGYALAFDGTTDYVELAQTALMLGPGWEGTKTVNLWVKPDGATPVCGNAVPAWCDAIFGDRPRWWGICAGCDQRGGPHLGVELRWQPWIIVRRDWDRVHSRGVGADQPGAWGGRLVAYKNGVEMGNVESGLTQQPSTGAQPVLHLGGIINNASRRTGRSRGRSMKCACGRGL